MNSVHQLLLRNFAPTKFICFKSSFWFEILPLIDLSRPGAVRCGWNWSINDTWLRTQCRLKVNKLHFQFDFLMEECRNYEIHRHLPLLRRVKWFETQWILWQVRMICLLLCIWSDRIGMMRPSWYKTRCTLRSAIFFEPKNKQIPEISFK